MNSVNEKSHFFSNVKNLKVISLVTLAFFAVSFVIILLSLHKIDTFMHEDVTANVQSVAKGAELRRTLISLELEIRSLLSSHIRRGPTLEREKKRINAALKDLHEQAIVNKSYFSSYKLSQQLDSYLSAFDNLFTHYITLNSILLELDSFHRVASVRLNEMEEEAGAFMVDYAMKGKNTSGLEQAFVLVALCLDHLSQGAVLMETAVRNNDPDLLGIIPVEQQDRRMTVVGNFSVLEKTLQTLTSTEYAISDRARELLEKIPVVMAKLDELYEVILALKGSQEIFSLHRDAILATLHSIDSQTVETIFVTQGDLHEKHVNGKLLSVVIFAVVMVISLLGWLVIRRIANQVEQFASEEYRARKETENINAQLHHEIEERRTIAIKLQRSHDELENRVKERTTQLTDINVRLQAEVVERSKTQSLLAAEKDRLAVTLRSIGDGVISTDVNSCVTLINNVAEKVTGWSSDEAIGRKLEDVFHIVGMNDSLPLEDPAHQAMQTGEIVTLNHETILVGRDGGERRIADSAAPIRNAEGEIIGAVLVFRDVTEQLRIENELMKARKLEAIGILAGGIAHDFNNILMAILGNISLASHFTDPDTKVHLLLKNAEKASVRAKDLTQQLLTFAKGGEPVKETSSLHKLIRESAGFVLHGSRVACCFNIPDDLWLVNIDKSQISQVIHNLVLNARHAMPEGGIIDISCANISKDAVKQDNFAEMEEDQVKIVVRDTGVGIPASLLQKIFDPYFSTKQQGSGLGLAITHSIITKHGGRIFVESEPGKGSKFTIYLPASGKGMGKKTVTESLEGSIKGRVMVMDDEDMVRNIARDMLVHLGMDVVLARDGLEAIRLYKEAEESKDPVDIVIMDLTVPDGMGGQEAAGKILDFAPKAKLIVASGYSNDPIMADFGKYGFTAAIEKPFTMRDLNRILKLVNTV